MTDPVNVFLENERERVIQDTMGHLTRAKEIAPETMAQAQRVSSETGLPPVDLALNPEGMAAHDEKKKTEDLLRQSPSLTRWLQTPENAALSQDELDTLARYEKALTPEIDPEGTAIGRAAERGVISTQMTGQQFRVSEFATALADGAMTPEGLAAQVFLDATGLPQVPEGVVVTDLQSGLAAMQDMGFPAANRVNFSQVLEERQRRAQLAQENPEAFIEGAEEAVNRLGELAEERASIPMSPAGERMKAALAEDQSLSGTAAALISDPAAAAAFLGETAAESAPIMVTAMVAGIAARSPAVAAAITGGGTFSQEVGTSAVEFFNEEGVDLTTREGAMQVLANVDGILDRASERGLTRAVVIASVDALSLGVAGKAVVDNPLVTAAAQTGVQATSGAGGEALAQVAAGQDLNAQEILIEGLAEGVGVVVEGPAAVISERRRQQTVAEGQRNASTVAEINEMVTETQMRERSPRSFRRFLQSNGFDQQNLYIDGTVLQEAVEADPNLLGQLQLTAAALERAVEGGQSVAVNLAAYMESIPGRNTVAEALFVQNARLEAESASRAEAVLYQNVEAAERAEEAVQEAESAATVATVREETATRVSEQLRAAGQSPAAARASGELHGAFFQTLAERYGEDVRDQLELEIVGPAGQTAGPRQSGRTLSQPPPMPGMEEVAALVADNAPFEEIMALPVVQEAAQKIEAMPLTSSQWDFSSPEFTEQRPYVLRDGTQIAGVERMFEEMEQISAEYAGGAVRQERRVDILLGPPAAGKSTIAEMIAPEAGARIVDSDDMKKLIPEFEGGVGANAVHEESSVLTKVYLDRVLARGDNVVIPKVGDNPDSIRKMMGKLKEAGYEVNLVNMEVAEGEPVRRMFGRFAATGRLVPPEYVHSVGSKLTDVYNQLKEEADGFASYDNNVPFGETPPVTEDTRRGAGSESAGQRSDDAGGTDTAAPERAAESSREADRVLAQDARGQITIPTDGVLSGTTTIDLFKSADLSTFLHESGHFFLEAFQAFATRDDAPEMMKADMATINEWMGRAADDSSTFTTEQQEMWAEAFEVYLMEGKAPTPSLKSAFSKFATWLTSIYKRTLNIGTQPTPEIRQVMDRLLATEEEIAEARAEFDSQALFKDIPPGMSEAEWTPYQKLVQREEAETKGKALQRTMDKIRRRRSKEYAEQVDAMEETVRAELEQTRAYRMINALGRDMDKSARLDKQQLIDMFGEGVLESLHRDAGHGRNLYTPGGIDIEIAADNFGYANATEMIRDIQSSPPLGDAAQAEAAARVEDLLEGDPLDEASIREEAEASLKNGFATERVAREAAALTRAASGSRGPNRWQQQNAAAKAEAQERVDQLTVREALGYRQFLRASQRSSREAQRQLATVVRKADGTPQPGSREALEAAADAKRTQLLNDHMYRIAREKARRFEAARKRFNRMQKKSIRANIGADFMDAIDTLLDQYSFRDVSLREVGRRADIRQLYSRLLEDQRGAEIVFDVDVLSQIEEVHYTELTVTQLEGVVDAVDNLAHMGRSTQKQLAADAQFDLMTALDAIEDRADENLTDTPMAREAGERSGMADLYRQFQLHVLNADSLLRDIDGDETALGPAYNAIKRGIDKGVGRADARRQEAAKEIADLYTKNFGSYRQIKKLREDKKVYPELGEQPLTRLGLVSMALNTGNEANFERLTNGDGKGTFNRAAVQKVLVNELTENEWQFVQDVWDYIDSYWAEIRDQERRYTGVTPKKVQPKLMIEGAPDFVKGGYYPIRYDSDISSSVDDMDRAKLATEGTVGVFGKAQTSAGHTKERTASTGRPLRLDLGIIDNHVFNVIHDLELRGPVRDAARIVYSERFGEMLTRKGRGEDTRALKAWLEDVAAGDRAAAYGMERFFRWMRAGFTLSAIGFKVSTIMIQPLGLTQSLVQVGYGAMVRGYSQYMKQGPARMHEFAASRSNIMQERIRTFDKDISQISQELASGSATQRGYKRFLNFYVPWAYAGMQHMQYWVVDLPTWVSSYEQALRNGETEADAITIADRDVRVAQGSGLMSDRGMIERGRVGVENKPAELARLFTVLGSYMFGKFNLAYRRVRGTDFNDPVALAKLTMDISVLFVVEAMLVYLLRNGWPDEDEDEPPMPLVAAREGFYTFLGTMPVFRDVASTLQGFGGGAAYAEYTGAVGGLFDAGGDIAMGEFDRKTLEGLLSVGGTALLLPSGQLNDMLDAAFTRDFEIEDDVIVNMLESMTGLPVGGEDES